MAVIDYIILGTLAVALVMGLVRGFLRQAFSLGGLVLGLILGSVLLEPVADFLQETVAMQHSTAQAVAFALILIVVPIVCGLLGRMLSKVVHTAGLGIIDRLLGALCGALIWLLLAGLVIKFTDITGLSKATAAQDPVAGDEPRSVLIEPLRDVSAACLGWTWEKLQTIEMPHINDRSGTHDGSGIQESRV